MPKKTSILARMYFKVSWNRMVQRKKYLSFGLASLVFSLVMFYFIFENRVDPSASYGDLIKKDFTGFVHTYYAVVFFSGFFYYMMFGPNSHSSFFHSKCGFMPIRLRSFYTLDLITAQVNLFSIFALLLFIHLYLLSLFHVGILQWILLFIWSLIFLTWISCFSSILSACISTIPLIGRFPIQMRYYIPVLFGTAICIIQLKGIQTQNPFLQVVGSDIRVPGIYAFSSTVNVLIRNNRCLFMTPCFWESIALFAGTLCLYILAYNNIFKAREELSSSNRAHFIQLDTTLHVLSPIHSSLTVLHLKEFYYLIRNNAILSYFIACLAVSFFYMKLYCKNDLAFVGKAGMILASPLLFAGMVYLQFLYDEKGSLNYYFNPLGMKIWVRAKHSALLKLFITNLACCTFLYQITTKDTLSLAQMFYLILVALHFFGFFSPLLTRHTIQNPWKARYRSMYIQHNNIRSNTYQFILLFAILLPVFLFSIFVRNMKFLLMILMILSGVSLIFYRLFNRKWERLFYSNQDNYLHDTMED